MSISEPTEKVSRTAPVTIPDPREYPDPLEYKLALAAGGCYLLPVKPGTKNPGSIAGKGWPKKSKRDPNLIRQWHEVGPEALIAIHTGRSGLVALDLDVDVIPGELDWCHAGCFQSTRSGLLDLGQPNERGHYVFASDTVFVSGPIKLADGTRVGEVRSGDTVIVSQPSTHHKVNLGGGYRWERRGLVPALPESAVALGYLRVHPGEANPSAENRCGPTYSVDYVVDDRSSNEEIAAWAQAAFNDGSTQACCDAIRNAKDKWISAIRTEDASYPNLSGGHFEILNLGAEGHRGWDAACQEIDKAYWVEVVEIRQKRPDGEVRDEMRRSYLDALRKIKGKVEQAAEIGAIYTPRQCVCIRKRNPFAYRPRISYGYRPRHDFSYKPKGLPQ